LCDGVESPRKHALTCSEVGESTSFLSFSRGKKERYIREPRSPGAQEHDERIQGRFFPLKSSQLDSPPLFALFVLVAAAAEAN
jgi:hypothetical protein